MGWPSVIEHRSEYRMYYNTFDQSRGRFVVGLAVAADGLMRWRKLGPVFAGSEETDSSAFDSGGASRRHVLSLPDGSFKMFYEAVSKDRVHSIGLAVSEDGMKWRRVRDQPVFTASEDPSAWDSGGVGSPHCS